MSIGCWGPISIGCWGPISIGLINYEWVIDVDM